MDITNLYKTQISLTEWFEKSNHKLTEELRIEDNDKRERLKVLNEIIGLPFDKPVQFKAIDLANETDSFLEFFKKEKNRLCALRLIPTDPSLPKLRMRGHTIEKAMEWFKEQKVNPSMYKADFVPHSENSLWSTIFFVNKKGISGEMIKGGHHQLTQGFYEKEKPIIFSFDFNSWNFSKEDTEAKKQIKEIASLLCIKDSKAAKRIKEELNATFAEGYLEGYFETVTTKEHGLWFIDYNRILGKLYQDYIVNISQEESEEKLKGLIGSKGKFTGRAKIIVDENLHGSNINKEEVLVCPMTTPDHLFLMKNAGAIVTDLGGILSHAAIIAREFNIPCLVGTEKATSLFKDNDLIEVDAENGFARKID